MNSIKPFRHLQSLFSDQDDLRWLFGGFLLYTGLISANMVLFVLGLYLFPVEVKDYQRAVELLIISSAICIFWQFPSFYKALIQGYKYPLFHSIGVSLSWCLCWIPWSALYIKLRQRHCYLLTSILIWYTGFFYEQLYIGFVHVGPMLVGTIWESCLPWFGESCVILFIWLAHLLRVPLLKHGLWFVPLLISSALPKTEINAVPTWLDEIQIFPEGVSRSASNLNVIKSVQILKNNQVFYASVGGGDVQGMSIKRHMVPLIEGGYTPYYYPRVLKYKEHPFLVLICNDALFSDINEEIGESEAVVVVSWLDGLEGSPLKQYFIKRLEYIHLKYQKPVRSVDAAGDKNFPKDG